jgi:hypothetical protein
MTEATLTRTFSLHSNTPEKKEIHHQLKERMVKFRALENTFIRVLLSSLNRGVLSLDDFKGENKAFIKSHINNRLELNKVLSDQFKRFELKERMKRCAIQYPYFAMRGWLQRNGYLSIILKELIELIQKEPKLAATFLRGGVFSRKVLKHLFEALKTDCFGNSTYLTYFYTENLIGQVRNLFLSTTQLETVLLARLRDIKNEDDVVRSFIEVCLRDFKRKKKGKNISIPVNELADYFLKKYVMRVKRYSTWRAKRIDKVSDFISFKCKRDAQFDEFKADLTEELASFSPEAIFKLAREAFQEVIDELETSLNIVLSKHVFKPFFRAAKVKEVPSYDDFLKYFKHLLRNQVKERLKELFLTPSILDLLKIELEQLSQNIHNLVVPPKIRKLALPINQAEQVYKPDFERLIIKVSFLSREEFTLSIRDDKGRIQNLLESGAVPCLPVITIKGLKLLLHLPFEVKRNSVSKPSTPVSTKKRVELGVDLGVRYPAVLSVIDRTNPNIPVEIARYFLSVHTLLDMSFNNQTGRFEPRARFSHLSCNFPSNQKLKLRILRREVRNVQRKLSEYENRLTEHGIVNPKSKFKYNQLKRTLSGLWERIKNTNLELVRLLNHVIVDIAEYHGASVIKFENLKWSKHSKKQKTGRRLSFWQTHWFFSQVQEAVKLQVSLRSIEFRTVKAAYTSQDCWECGHRGSLSGKTFTCPNIKEHTSGKPIQLQSDLNAARNIALAGS